MIKFKDYLLTNPGMEKDDHLAYQRKKQKYESRSSWSKSLETIARKRQLDKISDKDKATLIKIANMLAKEKK